MENSTVQCSEILLLQVYEAGAAHKDGRLRPGDQVRATATATATANANANATATATVTVNANVIANVTQCAYWACLTGDKGIIMTVLS